MTFGQTSFGRSISRTGVLLKKQLWIWPIIAVVLLAVIGYAVSSAIQRTMEDSLRSELQTLLGVERSMVEKWLKIQESNALTVANDPQLRKIVADLLAAEDGANSHVPSAGTTNEQTAADLHARLAKELEPALSSHNFAGYVVADKSQRIIAEHMEDVPAAEAAAMCAGNAARIYKLA